MLLSPTVVFLSETADMTAKRKLSATNHLLRVFDNEQKSSLL